MACLMMMVMATTQTRQKLRNLFVKVLRSAHKNNNNRLVLNIQSFVPVVLI